MQSSKIRCLVSRDEVMLGFYNLDLVMIENVPHVVFEWETLPDGQQVPLHMVEIAPALIAPMHVEGAATQQYRISIEDPRPVS